MIGVNTARKIVGAMADAIHQQRDTLSALDAALGDGDHGVNMDKALQAANRAILDETFETPGELFIEVGTVVMNAMGGASGIIIGSFFRGGGRAVKAHETLALADVTHFFEQGIAKVQKRGKAKVGDKTLLDALQPALDVLEAVLEDNGNLQDAMQSVAAAAMVGAEATKTMVAQHGRAKFLGERSLGCQDAGATSMALIVQAWADCLTGEDDG